VKLLLCSFVQGLQSGVVLDDGVPASESLAKEEKSIGEISEKLGSKRGTIIAVAKLLGIELRYERRSPTLGDCLRVKSLHESGLSLRAIAKQYDTNHVAIRRWIKAVS
jgi:IS30 family transposase